MAVLEAARARGRKGGRPKALDDKKRKLAINMFKDKKYSVKDVCDAVGITKPTLYRYLRQESVHLS